MDNNFMESPKQNKAFGIASMVCGILSLLCCCCNTYVGIAISIAAIVLFVLERVLVKSTSGMAVAGLVCGIISIVLCILSLALTNLIMELLPEELLEEMSSIMGDSYQF